MIDKYFVSIGGGENQLPLIQAALKNNLKVLTVDQNPQAVGFRFSDIRLIFSIDDYKEILVHIFLTINQADIVGVGTRSFGKASETVCYIAEKIGLNYIPKKDYVLYFSDKQYLKKTAAAKNISTVPSLELNDNLLHTNEKIILKPKNGSSKKNIFLLNSLEKDKLSQFKEKFDFKQFITENYMEGDEITVLGFVYNRKFYLVSIFDKIVTKNAPFIEIAHIAPSKYEFLAGEVILNCQTLAFATNLVSCPFVAEFKINCKNEIFLIEAQPEVGGEFLADFLVKESFGYDYFKNLVLMLSNRKFQLPSKKAIREKLKSQIHFYVPSEQKVYIQGIENFKLEKDENRFFEKNLISHGSIVSWEDGNHCRVKVIGISTKSQIDSQELYHSIQSRLNESIKYISKD